MRPTKMMALGPIFMLTMTMASTAPACQEGKVLVLASVETRHGQFQAIARGTQRSVVFVAQGGKGEKVLGRDVVPDYAESTLTAADDDLVVLEDHYFETDEGEVVYHWEFYSSAGARGGLDSMTLPVMEATRAGWLVTAVDASGHAASFTLCDGRALSTGSRDCSDAGNEGHD
jgi:hypothetical protein